jgi:hypothetical protein
MRGAAAHKDGFMDATNPLSSDMCQRYKFRTVGWKNVNSWGLWLIISLVLSVNVLSIEAKWLAGEERLVAEALWDDGLLRFTGWLSSKCRTSNKGKEAPWGERRHGSGLVAGSSGPGRNVQRSSNTFDNGGTSSSPPLDNDTSSRTHVAGDDDSDDGIV